MTDLCNVIQVADLYDIISETITFQFITIHKNAKELYEPRKIGCETLKTIKLRTLLRSLKTTVNGTLKINSCCQVPVGVC